MLRSKIVGDVVGLSDVPANMKNSQNDGRVTVDYDAQRDDPGSEEENQDENSSCYIVRHVIEAATGEQSFGYVFPYSEEWERGENGGIEPQ